jgi:hypothetical protein
MLSIAVGSASILIIIKSAKDLVLPHGTPIDTDNRKLRLRVIWRAEIGVATMAVLFVLGSCALCTRNRMHRQKRGPPLASPRCFGTQSSDHGKVCGNGGAVEKTPDSRRRRKPVFFRNVSGSYDPAAATDVFVSLASCAVGAAVGVGGFVAGFPSRWIRVRTFEIRSATSKGFASVGTPFVCRKLRVS